MARGGANMGGGPKPNNWFGGRRRQEAAQPVDVEVPKPRPDTSLLRAQLGREEVILREEEARLKKDISLQLSPEFIQKSEAHVEELRSRVSELRDRIERIENTADQQQPPTADAEAKEGDGVSKPMRLQELTEGPGIVAARDKPRREPAQKKVQLAASAEKQKPKFSSGALLERLPRKERERVNDILEGNISVLSEIASLYNEEHDNALDATKAEDRIDDLYAKLLKRIPKKVRQDVGDSAIRKELELYVQNYGRYVEELKGKIKVPTTKEGQEAWLRSFVSQYAKSPEKTIKTNDPLVAMLQSEFRKNARIAQLKRHPKGSGIFAQIERSGVPVTLENVAGWVETSVISAGFMMAIRTVCPLVDVAYALSLAGAIAISYGSNIPLKNKFLKKVMENRSVVKSLVETVKENPIKSAVITIGTVGLAITPAVNSSIREGLTSQAVATDVETKLAPAEAAYNQIGSDFRDFTRVLDGQLNALTTAEADPRPETIARLQREFPGMSFAQSGHGGTGPLYYAKRNLFFAENPPAGANLSAEQLRIVTEARREAGLDDGESLTDNLESLYSEFQTQTQERRERIAQLFVQVHSIAGEMMKQDIPYVLLHSGVLGQAPIPPSEIEPARQELERLLTEQGQAQTAMQTEMQRRIGILTHASQELLPGSSLSLSLPESDVLQQFEGFKHVELNPEHPLIADFSARLASAFNYQELQRLTPDEREQRVSELAPQYHDAAKAIVENLGLSFAISATFFLALYRGFSSKRRARVHLEQQEFHLNEARDAEEAVIDDMHEFVNESFRKFYPAYPEVNKMRIRLALREFVSKKAVELDGKTDSKERVMHWLVSNFFERGQNSEDTDVLASVKKIFIQLQDNPEYVREFIETLFPGYTKLSKTLDNDLVLMQKIAQGAELSEAEVEHLKGKFGKPADFVNRLNEERLVAMYSALDREVADLDLEYASLEHILGDIKVGADTYKVFSTSSEYAIAESGRTYTEAFNAKRYLWRVDKKGEIINPEVTEKDQLTMRRVAEETQAAQVIIKMMHENRGRRQKADGDRKQLEQTMVTQQVRSKKPGAINIPESVLSGNAKALRDQFAAGSGIFFDVGREVRANLSGIEREGVQGSEHSVQDQLNAMMDALFHAKGSRSLENFRFALNDGRAPGERLNVGIRLIYGSKVDRSLSEDSIEVPGFAVRVFIQNRDKEEIGFEDFQMSKVISVKYSPQESAGTFMSWARGATARLEAKFRKQWLSDHFANGDAQKDREGIFVATGNKEQDLAWMKNFYEKTLLRWKRAERARELMAKKTQITQQELGLFFEKAPQFEYKDVPDAKEMRRVVDAYYEKIGARGIGRIAALGTRMGGLTVDMNRWVVTKSSANKGKAPLPIAEYN